MTVKPIKNSHALFVSTVAAGALGHLISAPGSTLINIAIDGHFERIAEQHHMAASALSNMDGEGGRRRGRHRLAHAP